MIFESVTTEGLKLHFHVSHTEYCIPILLAKKKKSYYVLFSVVITIISRKENNVQ